MPAVEPTQPPSTGFAPLRGIAHSHCGHSVPLHACRSPIFATLNGSFFPPVGTPRRRGCSVSRLTPVTPRRNLATFLALLVVLPKLAGATSDGMRLALFL